jgi:uncharacterized protein
MHSSMRRVLVFIVLLVLLSAASATLLLSSHSVAGGLYMAFFMWSPGLAALITCVICRVNFEGLGWSWSAARHMSYGYVLPLMYIVPVYATTWFLIRGSLNLSSFVATGAATVGFPAWPRLATFGLQVPLLLTFGVFSRFPNTLGEELGWRGFLLPQLSRRYGFTGGCLVTGIIWAMWHYPLLFAFGFFIRPNSRLRITFFTIMVIGLSFVIGWLKFKANSLWPCILLHASHNVLLQAIFDPLTAPVGKVPYITTEFGGGLALTAGVVGLFLWRRRIELQLERP